MKPINCRWSEQTQLRDIVRPASNLKTTCIYDTCTCKNGEYEEPPNAPGAHIGNRVFLSTIKNSEPVIYTLTAKKSDLQNGILSVASPLGGAVHWKKEGDVVQAGPHHTEYLIEKIE